jgi:hypothetical protein
MGRETDKAIQAASGSKSLVPGPALQDPRSAAPAQAVTGNLANANPYYLKPALKRDSIGNLWHEYPDGNREFVAPMSALKR